MQVTSLSVPLKSLFYSGQKHTFMKDVSLILLITGIAYFFLLGAHGLVDPDEGRYSSIAWEMIRSHNYISPRVNGVLFLEKPILYYWLQVLAIKLFGLNAWALRFFPILSALCSIIFTYISARALFGRSSGLLSAFILASMPLFFGLGHFANMDMEVSNFITCSLLCFLLSVVRAKRPFANRLMLLAYVFSALAVLTKGLVGLAFPILIIGLWVILFNQWKCLVKMRLLLGISLFLLIVLPWFVLVTIQNPGFLHYYFIDQQVVRFLSQTFNNGQPFWYYMVLIILGALPWSFFLIQAFYYHLKASAGSSQIRLASGYLIFWTLTIFIFFSIPHSKLTGYIVPVFPPLSIILGTYLMTGINNKMLGVKVGVISYMILSVMVFFVGLGMSSYLKNMHAFQYRDYSLLILLLFCVGSLVGGWLYFNRKPLLALSSFIGVSLIALMVFSASVPFLGIQTMKTLAIAAKPYLGAAKEIAVYNDYFPSMPLYMQKRITVVNDAFQRQHLDQGDTWLGMFARGMSQDKSKSYSWLIGTKEFFKRWRSHKMLVALNSRDLPAFHKQKQAFWVIGCYRKRVLLANFQLTQHAKPLLANDCAEVEKKYGVG